jgi:hypothetical protein
MLQNADISTLKGERFVLALGFKFSPCRCGSMQLSRRAWWRRTVYHMANKKQRARQEGARKRNPQGASPSDLLPSVGSYSLEFPERPKIEAPAGSGGVGRDSI